METLVFVDGDDPSNLSFIIKKTPNGLYIPNAYMKLLEVEDGTEYEIKLGREAIRLVPIMTKRINRISRIFCLLPPVRSVPRDNKRHIQHQAPQTQRLVV